MEAFEIAELVRYLDDLKLKTTTIDVSKKSNYEAGLALNSLKISKELTPSIFACLEETCLNLKLDIDKVNAYITSSPEIQAGCMSFSRESCIVTLTSAIINLLDLEEMKFVLGHELGHFLLSHNLEQADSLETKEGYVKQRAQEISVDRLGLMACRDLNIATRAMVKTISGLDNRFINFDMNAFLNILEDDSLKDNNSYQYSSHPSFILRAKALIRFSLSDPYLQITQDNSGTNLKDIDRLIQNDLNTFIDRDLREDIKQSKDRVYFWGFAYSYVRDGNFSKEDQSRLGERFDLQRVESLKGMIGSVTSKGEVLDMVKDKFIDSINTFKEVAPNLAKKEVNLIIQEIAEETGQQDLLIEIIRDL
tara:strand:+ start:69 stop:1160 length:1092 start_codon:yes stop_codon:yes gene_type:complete